VEELVYQFLLQTAHYPRASIVSDTTMLFQNADTHPTFVVVDPENAKPLAAIHVVGPVNADGLYAASAAANQNARSLKPAVAQGFVVRIDFKGRTESEKVQFYCAKDKGELYPLTAASFPDLDSLRVYAKLNSKQYISAGGVAVMGGHVAGVTSTDAANNGSKRSAYRIHR